MLPNQRAPKYTVLIPARLASSRLPNKPLADLGGKPMIVRVAQRVMSNVQQSTSTRRVVVAADSLRIVAACQEHGVEAIMTRDDHASGSDRLAEACTLLDLADDEIVVNVQGDEPLMDPALVDAVAALLLLRSDACMSTAAHPIGDVADFQNSNVVKVVLDAQQFALYFSRAPIPMPRDMPDQAPWLVNTAASGDGQGGALRHIGIYAYRCAFLRLFPTLTQAPIEQLEALEQLRALWHGFRIAVHVTKHAPGTGVDTLQDLERVRRLFML